MKTKKVDPRLYKGLYKSYLFLNGTVLKPASIIGPIITVLSLLCIYKVTGSVALTGVYSLLFYVLLWSIGKLLWWVIQNIIRNTGTNDRFIFSGKYLIRNEYGDPIEINIKDIDSERFEFATEKTAALSADLNVKAYKNSAWSTNFNDKFQRNLSHIRKNNLSIMFVKSLLSDKYLGYTHILPVSKRTWERYLDGKISDNSFSDNYIAADDVNEKSYKQPYGLILFSIASVFYDQELERGPVERREEVSDLYEQAVAFHLKSYLNTQFKSQNLVEVLLQNMGKDYLDFFKGFSPKSNRLSADGAYIIVFDISNT